jgi:hypothetical protein
MLELILGAALALASADEPVTIYPGGWRLYRSHTCSLVRRYEHNVLVGLFFDPRDRDMMVAILDPALSRIGAGIYPVEVHLEAHRGRGDIVGKAEAILEHADSGSKRLRFDGQMSLLAEVQESAALRVHLDKAQIGRFPLDQVRPAVEGLKACIAKL